MLTCKQASFLASKRLDSKLTRAESFALWSHLLMCRLCRRYVKSLNRIHKAFSFKDKIAENLPGLSKSARKRIQNTLRKKGNPNKDKKPV